MAGAEFPILTLMILGGTLLWAAVDVMFIPKS